MHTKPLYVCIIFVCASASLKSQPTNLSASRVLLNRVALTWNDNTANETKFVIERKDQSSSFAMIAEVPANTTTYSDDLPEYNKVFTYRVYAIVDGNPTSFTNSVQWSTALFKAALTNLPNVSGSLDVADYTNDGKMDLLVMGARTYNGNTLDATHALFENSVTWSYQPVGSAVLPVTSSLSFEDLNGDHLQDLYQYGFVSGAYRTETFINAGSKTFISVENAFTTADYELLGWWDYDMDNDLDAVVFQKFATNPSKRRILRNDGDGNFFPVDAVDVNCAGDCPNQQFVTGDFDRDGDDDKIEYTPGVGYEMILNEGGTWQNRGFVFASEGDGELQVMDYDSDGWLDFLFLSHSPNEVTKLYKNLSGQGALLIFDIIKEGWPNENYSSLWSDVDHDGDLDVLFVGEETIVSLNQGNDIFVDYPVADLSIAANRTKWIDYDNDGDLDAYVMGEFITSGEDHPKSVVLYNQMIDAGNGIENNAPVPTPFLLAFQDEEGEHLFWQPSVDDHTPEDGLTYDVVLSKNGRQITKGPLNYSTGARYKLAPGRNNNFITLKNLKYGEYSWKVQAIDQSYKSSALSSEGIFTYGPNAPIAHDTVVYKCNREILISAEGEGIEWYSDEDLTDLIAEGNIFQPHISQTVFVTQRIDGVRGLSRQVNITVYEKPETPSVTTDNPMFLCEAMQGHQVTLSALGENVKWYSDAAGTTMAGNGPTIQVMGADKTYYVTQSIQDCRSDAVPVVLTPVMIDSRIYVEDYVVHTHEQDADHYEWSVNMIVIPNSDDQTIDFTEDGAYRVQIEKHGCSEISEPLTILDVAEGPSSDALVVSPNPSVNYFTIHLSLRVQRLMIYDAQGRVMFTNAALNDNSTISVDASRWSKGIYFVRAEGEQKSLTRKVVLH